MSNETRDAIAARQARKAELLKPVKRKKADKPKEAEADGAQG